MVVNFASIDDFNLLSLRGLLEARDFFHLHLIHKPNVIATAVGRYRIRKSDPWPTEDDRHGARGVAAHKHAERTLENSEVRPYSWPAILVFVKNWVKPDDFENPQDAIPPAVYMPSGQKVPICVIKAEKDEVRREGDGHFNFPSNFMGGGYPILCDVQGREHVASIACLVSDGHRTYALTNRHVAGEPGTVLSTIIGGNKVVIGKSATPQLSRQKFSEIYPGWPGSNIYVDLDIGLVDVDDLNRWTTQVYGIGETGPMIDLDVSNISLRLIGTPVCAYGAASGEMRGEIAALFYRFNSLGGFEYVSDVLIGPSEGSKPLATHPGDSGTLWLVDDAQSKKARMPIALQWGGQAFLGDKRESTSYALATFLSTACNVLDITLLRAWNIGLPEYWGAVGHYSIATEACGLVRSQKLKQLLSANLDRISFKIGDINKKTMQGLSKRDFVPLADVPDMVWKVGPHKRGGPNSPEHANHFADMDRVLSRPLEDGATLLEICKNKPENVAVGVWRRYYDAVQEEFPEHESRGLLPFRVWQIYDAMVSFVRAGEVDKFVCAAGILSHYVGDSCQPLHISYLFNGDPDKKVPGVIHDPKTHEKVEKDVSLGSGVHSAYEDNMIDHHVAEVIAGIDGIISRNPQGSLVTGGHGAAVAVVSLMQQTFDTIAPKRIIEQYVKVQDLTPAGVADALWEAFGEDTIKVMANGCICLAKLWDSAWKEGGGDHTITRLDAIDEGILEKLYQNQSFLPSCSLDEIGPVLQGPPNGGRQRRRRAA